MKRPPGIRGKIVDPTVSNPPPDEPRTPRSRAPRGARRTTSGRALAEALSGAVEVRPGGLQVERRFTREGVHPFDEVTWELRSATIANEKGETVFEQRDCEVPAFWSQMATNVVVSKYFFGEPGTPGGMRFVED